MIVAGSLAEIDRTLDRTRRLVAICALAAAIIAAGLATLLTRRALRPLTRLSSGARAIERSGDPAERLPSKTTRRRGRRAGGHAERDAGLAGARAGGRAPLRRRRLATSCARRSPRCAGNAAYIARHGADPEVIAEIEAGATRLSELLDDLLALAREDAAAPAKGEPVALKELAQGADEVIVEHDVTVRVERAAFERAVENLVRNARKHGQGKVTITVGAHDGEAFISVERRRPRHPAARGAHDLRPLRPRQRRARRGLRPRPGDREGDRRAPRRPRRGRRREVHARCQRTLKVAPYNCRKMKRLRTTSSPRLLAIVAVLVAVVAGAGIAQASLNDTAKPAPKPLDRAILDAANAPRVDGVTARIAFTNNLLPSGSLPENTASPTLTGAEGRLWLANDGRLRLELQSSNGDAQIVADGKRFMLYDAASKTAFTGALPESKERESPTASRRRSTASVRASPSSASCGRCPARRRPHRQPAELHRPDRAQGRRRPARRRRAGLGRRPRRAAARRRLRPGHAGPGARARGDRDRLRRDPGRRRSTPRRPKGAKVTELNPPTGVDAQGKPTHVTGLDDVQKRLDFQLAAPAELAGLPRRSVSLDPRRRRARARCCATATASGQILVFQRRAEPGKKGAFGGVTLPQVNIDGATGQELATALGTLVTFESDGISYLVAGSVPPVAAENAARGLK